MASYRYFKYAYESMEEALEMSDAFEEMFIIQDLYISHQIITMANGRFMVSVKIREDGVNS